MLIPIRTCSLYNQPPYANWVIIAITSAISLWVLGAAGGIFALPDNLQRLILDGWRIEGMVGYMLLHGGLFHLAGNMLFLWVFGNTVCAKTGSKWYWAIYLVCGFSGAAIHNVVSGGPVIGASGAINGIVGFYLVLQPINHVEMFYFIFFRAGKFLISGYWVILYWALLDVWGLYSTAQGGASVAYAAHLGGLLTGIVLGFVFVYFRLVTMDEYDNPTLLEYLQLVPMGYTGGYHVTRQSRGRSQFSPPESDIASPRSYYQQQSRDGVPPRRKTIAFKPKQP